MRKIKLIRQWEYGIIFILVMAAYWPTFTGDFILDDNALVKKNPFIRDSHSIVTYFSQEDGIVVKRDSGNYHSGYYRPLINITYRLDYMLWGMNAHGFRVTNVILHILCCFVLLYFLSLFMGRQIAFWITIIFALHPVNTESVSFITSRNNIIVTFFILGSLLSYIIGWEKGKSPVFVVSVILFSGAIFSKEFGLMAIPLFFLYQRLLARKKHNLLKESVSYVPFLIVAFFYLFLRKGVTESLLTPADIDNIWSRIYFTPFIIFYNLKLVFLPYKLHFIYLDYPENIINWYSTISFLLFLLICLALWKIRKHRQLIFSILAFLICIMPVSNIIPTSSISLISMRWLYLPMCFLFIGVGLFIKKAIIARRYLTLSILIIIISYLGGYTFILNRGLWHDDDTLIKQEVLGFNNYLFAPDIAEKYFINKQYRKAERYFKIAIEKFPYQALSYINYSALLAETGKSVDAITILNKAKSLVMTHHEQGQWHNNMGMALCKTGDTTGALKHLNKAVLLAPGEANFWANLGGVYGMTGNFEESVNVLKKGLAVSPGSTQLSANLAMSYMNLKDFKNALLTLEKIPEKERMNNKDVLRLLEKARGGLEQGHNDKVK